MIEHKNDKITTTRDTKQEQLSRWEDIRFQDLLKLSVLGESRVWRGIVFHMEAVRQQMLYLHFVFW